jgi:two-component system, chemotaxis family, response regulator Rcp1
MDFSYYCRGIKMTEQRRMQVLIVEDNNADARLVRALLEETGMPTDIMLVRDGEGAIRMMESAEKGESPAPDLVLMDINLPKKNGHEVLTKIRELDRLAKTYVAMCSGSSSEEDIVRASNNHANAYLHKPMGVEEMDDMVNDLRRILTYLNHDNHDNHRAASC